MYCCKIQLETTNRVMLPDEYAETSGFLEPLVGIDGQLSDIIIDTGLKARVDN